MSRNGSGIYNLPTGNPVVTGTTITSNWANTTLSDLATAMTGSVAADGQTPITGNLQMGGNKITGMADGTAASDATTVSQVAATAVMTGTILMWATASAPTGYLACNGTAVSRSTYSALFAIIGTTFGSGDGSTTFNLPNYTNRMPYGATVGATGGSADAIVVAHTHTFSGTSSGQSQTHTHSVSDPGHAHSYTYSNGGASPNGYVGPNGNTTGTTGSATTGISLGNASVDHTHTYSGTTASSGSSGTNANLPPYLGINFIIKA